MGTLALLGLALVAVGWASNAVGTINPIATIGELCQSRGIAFHVDAVQAVGALMLEQSDEWAVGRRYFSLESLTRLADTDPHGPPALAA